MMFMGNIMLALAVEYCNLHKRIALGVLLHVGSSPRWYNFKTRIQKRKINYFLII